MPYLLLTLSALIWSGNFVISRAMNHVIPPAGFVFWRWVLAIVVLAPIALPRLRRDWPVLRANLGLVCICGLFGVTLFNYLIYTAVHWTTAINAALVNSAIPIFIIMFGRILYRESVSLRQHLGIALSLAGVATIILQGDLGRIRGLSFNRGDLLVLLAAVVWALYSLALRRHPREVNPFVFLFATAVAGLIFLVPFYALELAQGTFMTVNAPTVMSIVYVGILASVVAFMAWTAGLRRVGAQTGGQFIHLMPAFSTILAVIFLGERLRPFHLTGIILIFTGILCATFRIKANRP
ncbi:DMT family transporter [Geomesophilobacter sediminis]|uniref:DMT family transporter n=1 Tax=Geomesophilobacter sediminis TaxID=2798584 RepID=A0A8J7M238_9BACT|nr:DMT family transporter [Geomesophilobacter sediminis]MBJ6727217.1 DMT family transporter [Geomesophilobacter sediminis]